jgi:ankyrin repeat protein
MEVKIMATRTLSFIVLSLAISVSTACSQSTAPLNTNAAATSPLMVAAREGKPDVVRALLSGGDVDVNVTDAQGNTPLIEASRFGHDSVARALVERGAKLDVKNKDGQTALMLAVKNGHDDVVRVLKEAGAKE